MCQPGSRLHTIQRSCRNPPSIHRAREPGRHAPARSTGLDSAHRSGDSSLISAPKSKKNIPLGETQTGIWRSDFPNVLSSARPGSRRTLYERSCCCMLTSSLWTSKISGPPGPLSPHHLIPISKFSLSRPSSRPPQPQRGRPRRPAPLPPQGARVRMPLAFSVQVGASRTGRSVGRKVGRGRTAIAPLSGLRVLGDGRHSTSLIRTQKKQPEAAVRRADLR